VSRSSTLKRFFDFVHALVAGLSGPSDIIQTTQLVGDLQDRPCARCAQSSKPIPQRRSQTGRQDLAIFHRKLDFNLNAGVRQSRRRQPQSAVDRAARWRCSATVAIKVVDYG
jgi:hypothetical protein